jgi:hypothetical protein
LALHEKNPTRMDDYAESIYVYKNRDMTSNFIIPSLYALANVGRKWPGFEEYGDKFRSIPTFWDGKPISGSLSALIHGDFWVNIMMFHYCPNTGKVDDVRFIDFQLSRYLLLLICCISYTQVAVKKSALNTRNTC